MKLIQPWFLGYGLMTFVSHDAVMAHAVFVMAIATMSLSIIFGWRASQNRELFIGQSVRTLDHIINKRFFEKELGLHIEENELLCQSSMEKGRERAEKINHAAIFMGVETAITLVVTFTILVFLKPVAGLIILMTLIVSVLFSLYMNNEVMTKADPIEKEYRAIVRRRNELWHNVERVLSNGKGEAEVKDLDRRFDIMLNREDGDRDVWLGYINHTPTREFANLVGTAAVVYYVGWQTFHGTATQSEFLSVYSWAGAVMIQVRLFARIERELAFCIPAVKRMRQALDLPKRVVDAPDAIELPDDLVEVTFESVSHNYKGGNNVLEKVSMTIGRGKSVALIGPSGAGKSTIVRLIQRYMDPVDGRILVNGIDLRKIKLASWQRLIAYIPQKPQIMDGTLRDNLLYGLSADEKMAWDDERLWAFVRRFRVDFGSRLNKGLDTQVGKHGVELSGGEAQRVMIASAAIRNARLYIIDEATSSLDAESQAAVQDALYELLASGASALFIAHRLSTISRCDDFVVLQQAALAKQLGVPQVEAVASSQHQLSDISPTFRRLAELEGITVAA